MPARIELPDGAARDVVLAGPAEGFVPDGSGAWSPADRVDPDDTSGASWPLGFGYSMAAADG